MVKVGTKNQTGPTPNFIRDLFRKDALVAREVLMGILTGGLVLSEPAAQAATGEGLKHLGCTLTTPLQIPTITERLNAAKLILQTGVGFKIDHTSNDETIRRQVVIMPPWDESSKLEPIAPAKGALTSGEPEDRDGDGASGKAATRRRTDGNGDRGS